jgi:glucokinase
LNTVSTWIGVDFGASNLRAAVLDLVNGTHGPVIKSATPALEGPLAVIEAIAVLVTQVIAASKTDPGDLAGVGIGCPALIDLSRGVLMNVPNIPGNWPATPFQEILRERLGLPVFPINDVRAITLGEYQFGAGRGVKDLACYAIGTGIGGGVVINGQLHLGISGSAGELGHQVVEPDGLACNCGGRGCLETIASGLSIAAQAVDAIVRRKETLIIELCHGDLNQVSTARVIEAAKQGDRVARDILERAGKYLGIAIANTLVTVSPRRILIGGGVATAGELLLDPIRRSMRERAHMVPIDEVEIVSTTLGDAAGLLGAGLWARSQSLS